MEEEGGRHDAHETSCVLRISKTILSALFRLPLTEFTGARNVAGRASEEKRAGRDEAASRKALANASYLSWAGTTRRPARFSSDARQRVARASELRQGSLNKASISSSKFEARTSFMAHPSAFSSILASFLFSHLCL